jgi:hypothetical protein
MGSNTKGVQFLHPTAFGRRYDGEENGGMGTDDGTVAESGGIY